MPKKIELPAALRDWILHQGSFMQRLQDQGIINSRIQVLQQLWQCPKPDERRILKLKNRHVGLIREVLITNKSHKLMFARTVIPFSTITGKHKQLSRLQNRSLGSALFKDASLKRSEFDIMVLSPESDLYQSILNTISLKKTTLWSRRSLFTIGTKSLLLTEVFLPGLEKIGGKGCY